MSADASRSNWLVKYWYNNAQAKEEKRIWPDQAATRFNCDFVDLILSDTDYYSDTDYWFDTDSF